MTIKLIKRFAGAFILLTTLLSTNILAEENYIVIVNSNNDISGTDEQLQLEVKRLFLKQKKKWSNGLKAIALAPDDDTEACDEFVKSVLGMTKTKLDQFWRSARQTSGTTPNKSVRSTNVALRMVKSYDGAFAILSADEGTDLPEGTRKLFAF